MRRRVALARNGLRVILTEETDWIGGQLSQQAVPPDEHPWIESFGAPSLLPSLPPRSAPLHQQNYPLLAGPLRDDRLNPGACSVSSFATSLEPQSPRSRRCLHPTSVRDG
ncbi:MAG: FAD-dependent oxidoreductase [Bryobacterales bacterium]